MSGFAHGQRVAKGDRWVCADCGQTVGWLRRSFNYKRLKKENYFQTREGRAAIEMIHRRYPDDSRVRDWLLKLAKNGVLMVSPTWQTDIDLLMEGEASGDPHLVQSATERLDSQRPDIVFFRTDKRGDNGQPEPVQPGVVIALGKMLDQGYKGKGIDLMNMTFDEVEALYEDWEQTHKRDPDAGQVVHAFPDGWTMRRLEDRDQAFAEGAEMRNCVPQYAPSIDGAEAHVFSLRDDQNRPHANVLIVPRDAGGHWEGGTVRDVRGKANSTPMDKYADYLRHWFDTFNEKPRWSPNPGPAGDPGPGSPDRYGLGNSLNYASSSTTESWIFESSWQVESNWNRVRNQLRHNNQFDEETEMTWNYLKGLYGYRIHPETGEVVEDPKHDKLADWIMREVRNGNIQVPHRLQVNLRELKDLQRSNERYRLELRGLESEIAQMQTGEGVDQSDYPMKRLIALAEQAQDYRDYIARNDRVYESTRQSLLDPEKIQRDLAKSEDDGTSTRHYWPTILIPNTENYQREPLKAAVDHDWLGALQTVVKGRQDKAKALRKNPTAYEDKIAEIREKMRGLSPDDETYLKLNAKLEDYQKRISDAENSDLNTLQAPSVAEEVQREAWIRRLAQDGGKVLHTFPDGKTIRWINSADVARLEGDIMGHCIGDQYHDRCANGSSVNLSVRDKRGMPHATFEVLPKRQPTINWQNFFNSVEENPEKFEHLAVDDPDDERVKKDDLLFGNEIGTPIFDMNDNALIDDNGADVRVGDYVRVRPTDTDGEPIEGWVTNGDGGFGVHRIDGTHGGGYASSWNIPEIMRGSDHGLRLFEKIAEPADEPAKERPPIDRIKQRTKRWTVGEPEYREWKGQELAESDPELSKALIATDSYMPAIEGSHAHQVQGKGNKVPEQRYHKYLRDYFGSFSDEDRPLSVWSSYFTSKPVQYVDHLPDLDKNIDELGARVEGDRGIDWNAIVHSANEGRPEMKGDLHNKAFIPIDSSRLTYDPEKGQQLLDAAQRHGGMRDLFESINKFEDSTGAAIGTDGTDLGDKSWAYLLADHGEQTAIEEYGRRYREYASDPEAPASLYDYDDWLSEWSDHEREVGGYSGIGEFPAMHEQRHGAHRVWARCPDCDQDTWLRDDQDGEVRHEECPQGSRYIEAHELFPAETPVPDPSPSKTRMRQPSTGPRYTPYQAALVQHLGPQIETYFRTQAPASDYQWALHGAPKQMALKCPSCGSDDIRPCNQCQPADHYICNNCGTMMNMPGSQVVPAQIGEPVPAGAIRNQAKISEGIEGCPYNHGRHKRLHIGSNGDLCACLYNAVAHKNGIVKQADKMNDFLMDPTARPDLQTPEAQEFLGVLKDKYHTPKTDPLMPWLTREWKKNRVYPTSTTSRGTLLYRPYPGEEESISPEDLNHWADWYHSDHPTRRGVDIMQLQAKDMAAKIGEWEAAMKAVAGGAATHKGPVDHEWPDGWTVQRLEGQKPLEEEGDLLAHCIGGYHQSVRDGGHLVYSLRDQDNTPQCSWAIIPNASYNYCPNCEDRIPPPDPREPDADGFTRVPTPRKECPNCGGEPLRVPHHGTMEQIQARGNSAPTAAMQRRIKDWVKARFTDGSDGTEDTRPKWDDQDIYSFDDFGINDDIYTEYHPGDYGLNEPETYVYPSVWRDGLEGIVEDLNQGVASAYDPQDLATRARDLNQLGELSDAVEATENKLLDHARFRFNNEYERDPGGMAEDYGKDRFEQKHPTELNHCPSCGGEGELDDEECPECGGEGVDKGAAAAEEYYNDIAEEVFDAFLEDRYYDSQRFLIELSREGSRLQRTASKPIPCQTCGDLTEHGFCPRCDWGGQAAGAEWAEVTPIPSVKRDIAEGFQASIYDWALEGL